MATPTIFTQTTPTIFLNTLDGQTTPTLCAKFHDEINDISFTVLFFVKNGKLNIKIPSFENDLVCEVYHRIQATLWDHGFAVCYFHDEETSGGKKSVIVQPSSIVAEKLVLCTLIKYKLGFVANKLTGGRVPALEQNSTITLLGKNLAFALTLLSTMFPSLKNKYNSVTGGGNSSAEIFMQGPTNLGAAL